MSGASYVGVLVSGGKEGQIGRKGTAHLRLEGQLEGERQLRQHQETAQEQWEKGGSVLTVTLLCYGCV